MKKHLYAGALIVVIGVSAFVAQKQFMELADYRADEIYGDTVAQVAKSLPTRIPTQQIVTSKEDKEFLKNLVAQEYKGENYIETTLSGTIVVQFYEDYQKDGTLIIEEGKNTYKVFLNRSGGMYELENIAYPLTEELNGAKITLSGMVSVREENGYKKFIVNLNKEEVESIISRVSVTKTDWASGGNRTGVCDGNYCALVILVDTIGYGTLPTSQEMYEYIFSNPGNIKNNLFEQSYGQMNYGGTVIDDWIQIDPATTYGTVPPEVEAYLTDHAINLADYDQLVYLISSLSYQSSSSVGPYEFTMGGNIYNMARSIMRLGFYLTPPSTLTANGNLTWWERMWIHETGHALGAQHDNFLACSNGPVSLPSECVEQEYGNLYSSMGIGTLGSHFSFYNKYRVGWIDESDIAFQQEGSFTLNPTESPNPNFVKTFPLAFGNYGSRYGLVFEFRKPIGFDSVKKRKDLKFNGVFVYRNSRSGYPRLTDVSPATDSADSGTWTDISQKDAVLKNAESLFDVNSSSTITGSYSGNTSDMVVVNPLSFTGGINIAPNIETCVHNPLKVFDYTYQEVNPAINIAEGQLPGQDWPQSNFMPDLSEIAVFSVDNSDQNSEISLNLKYDVYNNDYPSCGNSNIQGTIYLDNQPIETISFFQIPWSWGVQNHSITIPAYNLSYGQHIITLDLNKPNDGSSVSYDVVFEVEPI